MEPDPETPPERLSSEAVEDGLPVPGHRGPPADAPDPDGEPVTDDIAEDQVAGGGELPEGKDPLRFSNWMKRSATGAVMTGISIGLREALEPNRKEPAIMIEASGEPDDPNHPIRLHFDPDNPADSVAVIRRPGRSGPERPTEGAG